MDDGGRWLVVGRRRRVVAGEQQAGQWRPRWFLMHGDGLLSLVGKKMVNGGGGVKLAMAVLAGGVMILVGQARKRTGERVMKVVVLPAVVGGRDGFKKMMMAGVSRLVKKKWRRGVADDRS
ncbi:hypothetical protein Dimus_017649, partial [Dionaea muscipula]